MYRTEYFYLKMEAQPASETFCTMQENNMNRHKSKDRVVSVHARKAYRRIRTYVITHSLSSILDEDEWSVSRPGRFILRVKAPGIHRK
jgi:hypothetical protein